jgi:hypothetical protein
MLTAARQRALIYSDASVSSPVLKERPLQILQAHTTLKRAAISARESAATLQLDTCIIRCPNAGFRSLAAGLPTGIPGPILHT